MSKEKKDIEEYFNHSIIPFFPVIFRKTQIKQRIIQNNNIIRVKKSICYVKLKKYGLILKKQEDFYKQICHIVEKE